MATTTAEIVDDDSGCGSDLETMTESASSSLYRPKEEHGRTYHRYPGAYYTSPQDDIEQSRLEWQHELFLKLFDGKLFQAPIQNPQRVLDIGTGIGIWATDFADQHPESEVIGVDLSPIQPEFVPPNCRFEIFDYNQTWSFQKQDFVFTRMPFGSITKLRSFLEQVYKCLEPGGWYEVQDICPPTSDDGSIPEDSNFQMWINKWCEGYHALGRDPYLITKVKTVMRDIGFDEVKSKSFKIPQNEWPQDKQLKDLGRRNLVNMLEGLQGFSLRVFTVGLDWSETEMEILLAKVRNELHDTNIHAYWPL